VRGYVTGPTSVHCHVLGARVSLVTNFEGEITTIICPEFESATGGCRIRRLATEGGPLSEFLERVAEDGPPIRTTRCDIHT
jgi:hypothetical protein